MPTESFYSDNDVHAILRDPVLLEKHGGKISRLACAAIRKYAEKHRKPKDPEPGAKPTKYRIDV